MNLDAMKNHELDYQAALAMGARPDLGQLENQYITGLALKHFPARGSYYAYFRLVEPAGISTVWSPTTRWSDFGIILRRLIATEPVTFRAHGSSTACLFAGEKGLSEDPRIAAVRAYIRHRLGAAVELEEGCFA